MTYILSIQRGILPPVITPDPDNDIEIQYRAYDGPQGPAGGPLYIETIASENIGGHRVVNIFGGYAGYANNVDRYSGQLGITMSAVSINSAFNAYIAGIVSEPTWNFIKAPVYLSSNGLLTQTMPTAGAVIMIGHAITAISINIQPQIICKRG